MNAGHTTEAFEALPILDLTILQQLVDDTSEDAATAIMGAFLAEIDKLKADTAEATAQAPAIDFNLVSASAHRCKSSAGYCGAVKLRELTTLLEQACRDEDETQTKKLLEHLSEVCSLTRLAIEERNQA